MNHILTKIFNERIINLKSRDIDINNCISNNIIIKNGIKRYNVILKNNDNKDIVVKLKNKTIINKGINLLCDKNLKLKIVMIFCHKILNYNDSHKREIYIYNNLETKYKKYLVNYYGAYKKSNNNYYIVLDYINIKNKIDYKRIINALTDIQSLYYNNLKEIKKLYLNNHSKKDYKKSKMLFRVMFNSLNNSSFSDERISNINHFINKIDLYTDKYSYHKSFTHNDFSSRNIFMNDKHLYFYDFELASYQNPEHDLIEFLIYELENYNENQVIKIIDYYKITLLNKINVSINDYEYNKMLIYNIYEFIVNRLSMLRLIDKKMKMINTQILIKNANQLLDILGDELYE